ncbi:MAG TPA: lactate racemase domain-containing protein [Candidatus Lokiarchaeia archaeon]|nr:lactate racemase domain-containing protein [Candidatus Lokiarchaeia archaeon]
MSGKITYHKTPVYYGEQVVDEFVPKKYRVKYLEVPHQPPSFPDLAEKLDEVIRNPVDGPTMQELVAERYEKGKPVVFLVDDNTRPNVHTKILLPPIRQYLIDELGVDVDDIRYMIVTGTHAAPPEGDLEIKIFGPALYQVDAQDDSPIKNGNVWIHSCREGNREIGTTQAGTPVMIDERVLDAAFLIGLSDSEWHYFAGQAGTVKQICPGCADRLTINTNHSYTFDVETGFKPLARMGSVGDNPVLKDMREIAGMVEAIVPIFSFDCIVDHGRIVELQSGKLIENHWRITEILKKWRNVPIDEAADIVILSAGKLGINWYQGTKGVDSSSFAVKPGGHVLIMAVCRDGVGSDPYYNAMLAVENMNLDDGMRWLVENTCTVETFEIGNQNPVNLFMLLKKIGEGHLHLYADMDYDILSKFRGNCVPHKESVQAAIRTRVEEMASEIDDPLIYIFQDMNNFAQLTEKND